MLYKKNNNASLFVMLLAIFLAGCTVKPLYNDNLQHKNKNNGGNNIIVDVIAERDGQKLRSHLIDMFRDLEFANKKYRLKINLSGNEKPFAISNDGTAKRVSFIYVAKAVLQDNSGNIVMEKNISVSTSYNIAHSHGEVTLSLYGRHNDGLIKELCHRIVENVRMTLPNED